MDDKIAGFFFFSLNKTAKPLHCIIYF